MPPPPPRALSNKAHLAPLYVRVDQSSKALSRIAGPLGKTNTALDDRHPQAALARRDLRQWAQTCPLKWSVFAPVAVSSKSSVRNWARRRVVAAFTAALKQHGWDENGRTIAADRPLTGWVKIMVDAQIVENTFPDVEARVGQVLRKIVSMQRTPRQGQSLPQQQQHLLPRGLPSVTRDGAQNVGSNLPNGQFIVRRTSGAARR